MERDWSREEDFASYLSSIYGVSRLDVLNPIHDFNCPPEQIKMTCEEHQKAIDLISEATDMLEKHSSSSENREAQLTNYRTLNTKIDQVVKLLPSNNQPQTSQFIVDVIK